MDAVKEWAVSLCAAAILCAAVGMLSSEQKNKGGGVRIVVAGMLLCLMIAPLSQMTGCREQLEVFTGRPTADSGELEQLIGEQAGNAAAGALEELIQQRISALGYDRAQCDINMNISDDGCISIGQVTVIMTEASDAELSEVKASIGSVLGVEADVRSAEEREWR